MSKTNYKQTHSALYHSRDNTGKGDGQLQCFPIVLGAGRGFLIIFSAF